MNVTENICLIYAPHLSILGNTLLLPKLILAFGFVCLLGLPILYELVRRCSFYALSTALSPVISTEPNAKQVYAFMCCPLVPVANYPEK